MRIKIKPSKNQWLFTNINLRVPNDPRPSVPIVSLQRKQTADSLVCQDSRPSDCNFHDKWWPVTTTKHMGTGVHYWKWRPLWLHRTSQPDRHIGNTRLSDPPIHSLNKTPTQQQLNRVSKTNMPDKQSLSDRKKKKKKMGRGRGQHQDKWQN